MQQIKAQVTHIGLYDPLPGFVRVRLTAPALASGMKPGQFLLTSTETEYVRMPLFPISLGKDGFTVLLPPQGPLRRLTPGDELDCIGPLGKGFPLSSGAYNLLLLAQAAGFGVSEAQHSVTFLLALIDQALAQGKRVLLIQEASTAAQLFPPSRLPRDVEVRLVTEDGSLGEAGTARGLLPEFAQWADQIFAVGVPEWYTALIEALREHRLRVSEGLVWGLISPETMPCGLGACGGCAIKTRRGYQYACTEGPVFDLTMT